MLPLPLVFALFLPAPILAQQPLTADAIMARVASNQDASELARSHYLYTQHAHIASRRGKTIHCEETTDTRITPTPTGSHQQLLTLDGRLLQKHHYITYTQLPTPKPSTPKPTDPKQTDPKQTDPKQTDPRPSTTDQDDDINIDIDDDTMDRDIVENIRKNLTATHSKDGISANLFPLTTKEQTSYNFTLLARELRNGRDSFHIAFAPKDRDDFDWKGDAWIDATAFQPIVIRTTLSRKLPLAIRLLLGTNVPGLGFTIVYAPQSTPTLSSRPESSQPLREDSAERPAAPAATITDAVWFPTSFGTEFKIHVLFFFTREIVFNAENRDFHQTHTSATIHDAPTQ
jgi:hypothetical protein